MRDLGDELLQAKVKATLFGGDHAPRLGRLVILDRLGKGAMGTVFRAYDPGLDRTVAVKLVHAGAATAREARALGKLHHPNVVAVHDVGELEGSVYIVMELAPGVPLRTWIAGDRTWRDVVRVMAEAAAGLAAAHRAGLVHRDIKPDNIIVGEDRTRVVDFGLAHDAGTQAERGAGTPSYMAPEALDGDAATAASDQFGFGVTLYEALYGVRPHAGKSRDELRDAARTAAAAKPSRSGREDVDASADTAPAADSDASSARPGSDVDRSSGGTPRVRTGRAVRDAPPGWVHAIAVRALAADPAKRFSSMDDLAAALGRDRRRKRVLAGAVAGATIAGAVIGAVAYRHGASPSDLCSGGAEKRERVWSTGAAERARTQLAAAPWGARVMTVLDDTARAWETSYRSVCEATRVKGAQSDTLLDLRMRCLDRALDRFGALAEALSAPLDAQARAEATGAVAELPRPASCESITEAGELALPADAAARARATAAEHSIDRAWAAYSLGRYRDAAAVLGTLPAVTLDAPGVDAAALLVRAAVEARIGKPHTARALLEQALAAAARAHAVELEAEVWARLLRHELFAGQPAHAIEWAPFALAAAARAGREGAEIDGIVGEALRDAGRYAEAKTRLAKALASKDALRGDRRALILVNIGSVDLALGAPAAAEKSFTDALALATAQLGDGHPTLAIFLDKLSAAARAQGRLADALALNDRSLALRTAAYGADDRSTASSYLGRARTLLESKRFEEALADAERARVIRSTQLGATSARLGEVDALIGDIELARGDQRAALARYERGALLDPRLDLIARRAAAGADIALADLPAELDPLTADRAAALALRVAKLPHAEGAALAAQLLARYHALPRPVDPALARALEDAQRAVKD